MSIPKHSSGWHPNRTVRIVDENHKPSSREECMNCPTTEDAIVVTPSVDLSAKKHTYRMTHVATGTALGPWLKSPTAVRNLARQFWKSLPDDAKVTWRSSADPFKVRASTPKSSLEILLQAYRDADQPKPGRL